MASGSAAEHLYHILVLLLLNVTLLSSCANAAATPLGHTAQADAKPRLLVISLDGFRWDYLTRIKEPNHFADFSKGILAESGILNAFTTKTFPNHYTLATGLYEDAHGIIMNDLYDRHTKELVKLKNAQPDNAKYFGGEPIWSTYVKEYPDRPEPLCVMWVGCVYEIAGVRLKEQFKYNKSMPFRARIDLAIKGLSKEDKQLAMLYYHEPDSTGHTYGPESLYIDEKLNELNADVGYLSAKIKETPNLAGLNVIIVSDHGMATVNKSIEIPVRADLFKPVITSDVIWHIIPNEGKAQETIDFLNSKSGGRYKAYLKRDLPGVWHYADHENIMPVVLVANAGYTFAPLSSDVTYPKELPPLLLGTHGYDNRWKVMRPVFMASGPAFKQGLLLVEGDEFRSVDLYNLISGLLGLTPAPNNGSISEAKKLLSDDTVRKWQTDNGKVSARPPVLILGVLSSLLSTLLFY